MQTRGRQGREQRPSCWSPRFSRRNRDEATGMSQRCDNGFGKVIPRTESLAASVNDAANASVDQARDRYREVIRIRGAAMLIVHHAKLRHLRTQLDNRFHKIMALSPIDP